MECFPRGSKQLCIRKDLAQCFLNNLWTTLSNSNSMQRFLRGSREHCISKNHMQFCFNALGTTFNRSKPYAILSEWLRTTQHKKKSSFLLFYYFWDNITLVKPKYSVFRESPDNIALEKTLCNFLLILSGQYWICPNLKQNCPRDTRQLCITKNLVQYCLDTLGTTLFRAERL